VQSLVSAPRLSKIDRTDRAKKRPETVIFFVWPGHAYFCTQTRSFDQNLAAMEAQSRQPTAADLLTAKQRSDAYRVLGEQQLMGTFESVSFFFPAPHRSKASYFVHLVSVLCAMITFLSELVKRITILASMRQDAYPSPSNGHELFAFALRLVDAEIMRTQSDDEAAETLIMISSQESPRNPATNIVVLPQSLPSVPPSQVIPTHLDRIKQPEYVYQIFICFY